MGYRWSEGGAQDLADPPRPAARPRDDQAGVPPDLRRPLKTQESSVQTWTAVGLGPPTSRSRRRGWCRLGLQLASVLVHPAACGWTGWGAGMGALASGGGGLVQWGGAPTASALGDRYGVPPHPQPRPGSFVPTLGVYTPTGTPPPVAHACACPGATPRGDRCLRPAPAGHGDAPENSGQSGLDAPHSPDAW